MARQVRPPVHILAPATAHGRRTGGSLLTLDTVRVVNNPAGSTVVGGVYVPTGALTVINSTFSGNTAQAGGAIYHDGTTLKAQGSAFNGRGGAALSAAPNLHAGTGSSYGGRHEEGEDDYDAEFHDRILLEGGSNRTAALSLWLRFTPPCSAPHPKRPIKNSVKTAVRCPRRV
ncbi:MAG TPA: hypothetical protein VN282_24340 [Pyrinomonadaceae bacterium]|nr:hypothetical protein [Pyrinomonadaceae bacterium]